MLLMFINNCRDSMNVKVTVLVRIGVTICRVLADSLQSVHMYIVASGNRYCVQANCLNDLMKINNFC